ncbi:MAG: hypothetical protein ACTHM6_14875 [Tepidisphaeraceae bacterium]
MIEKLENEPFKFGRAAAKLFDELNAAIDELNQREEAIDKRRIALTRAAAGRPLKSAERDAMIDLDVERESLLPAELELRERLRDEWFHILSSERLGAELDAQENVSRTRQYIRQKLLEAGYPLPEPGRPDIVSNDFYLRHPAHRKALDDAQAAVDRRMDRRLAKWNEAAIGELSQQIREASRRRSRAALG